MWSDDNDDEDAGHPGPGHNDLEEVFQIFDELRVPEQDAQEEQAATEGDIDTTSLVRAAAVLRAGRSKGLTTMSATIGCNSLTWVQAGEGQQTETGNQSCQPERSGTLLWKKDFTANLPKTEKTHKPKKQSFPEEILWGPSFLSLGCPSASLQQQRAHNKKTPLFGGKRVKALQGPSLRNQSPQRFQKPHSRLWQLASRLQNLEWTRTLHRVPRSCRFLKSIRPSSWFGKFCLGIWRH